VWTARATADVTGQRGVATGRCDLAGYEMEICHCILQPFTYLLSYVYIMLFTVLFNLRMRVEFAIVFVV